jgi:hypothetical protein
MPNSERYSAEQRKVALDKVARLIFPRNRMHTVAIWSEGELKTEIEVAISLQLDLTRALEYLQGFVEQYDAMDAGKSICKVGVTQELRDFLSQRAR